MGFLPPCESGKTPLEHRISVTLRAFRSGHIAVPRRPALRNGLSAFTLKSQLKSRDVDYNDFSIFSALALLPVAALAGHHEGCDHAVAAEEMGEDVG